MKTLPVCLDIAGRQCLLVGTGEVADRKRRLLECAGAIVIASGERFAESALDGVLLVVAASEDLALNEQVSCAARARQLPVNVVDQPSLSTFIFPSIVERGHVTVAVSSSGTLPVLARLLRARIESLLPPSLGEFVAQASKLRKAVREVLPTMAQRRRFWDQVLQQSLLSGSLQLDASKLSKELLIFVSGACRGSITLVGTGTGDSDMLTIRALRYLQGCDVLAYYQDTVAAGIIDLARRDARQLAFRQGDDVVSALIEEFHDGMHVVFIFPGDPLSHRDVPLWLQHWQARQVSCTVVPGVIDIRGELFHDS